MYNVNLAGLDWLTMTSFEAGAYQRWVQYVNELTTEPTEAKRMQYLGVIAHHATGSAFVGTGTQRKMLHTMAQVSGMLAEDAFTRYQGAIYAGHFRVTRLDLQITVEYDRENWSQSALFATLREKHPKRSVSYAESQSGPAGSKLATVYFGSRTSDRIIRIYEKPGMGEDVFLRFEIEYKGARANETAQQIAGDRTLVDALLWHEILRLDVDELTALYDYVFDDTEPKNIRIVKESGNTKRWLLDTCLPALDRFLNDHNGTQHHDEVLAAFLRVLDEHARNH